jgi:hypothetical protein
MTPEFAAFKQRFERARDAGLVAAALLYQGAVREKLIRGYTSGAFVTGATSSSVQMTAPHDDAGGREVVVGSNELVALYWEMGHHNLFTRKYERVEHWRHALEENAPKMLAAYAGAFQRALQGAA